MWKVLWGFIFRALASRMRTRQEGQEPGPKNGLPEYLEQLEPDSPHSINTEIWVSLKINGSREGSRCAQAPMAHARHRAQKLDFQRGRLLWQAGDSVQSLKQ